MSQRSRAAIVFGLTGQTIKMVPPEHELIFDGAPTAAASYAVWRGTDSNDQPTVLAGTATLDAVSTTVAAASGAAQANPRKIALSSKSGMAIGTSYAMKNASGETEVVTPWELGNDGTNDYAYVELELQYDYSTGATVVGLSHTFTVDSTFVNDLGNINVYGAVYWQPRFVYATTAGGAPPYRVRWSYATGDGKTRYYWTLFDLVRAAAKHNVTLADITARFPALLDLRYKDMLPTLQRQLDAAWDAFVFDLKCCNYPVDQLREGPAVDYLVMLRALAIISSGMGIAPPNRNVEDYIKATMADYEREFNKAIGSTLKVWIDVGTTGAIHPDPPRTARLRR